MYFVIQCFRFHVFFLVVRVNNHVTHLSCSFVLFFFFFLVLHQIRPLILFVSTANSTIDLYYKKILTRKNSYKNWNLVSPFQLAISTWGGENIGHARTHGWLPTIFTTVRRDWQPTKASTTNKDKICRAKNYGHNKVKWWKCPTLTLYMMNFNLYISCPFFRVDFHQSLAI